MLLPLKTDRPLRQTPVMNFTLIGVTIVMFGLQQSVPAVEAALLLRPYEPTPLNVLGSVFLHAGWLHLLGNMLFLYIFGNNINDHLGHAGYLGFYLGGGAAAGLLHVVVESAPALGASGAVAAVSGAYLVMFPKSRILLLFLFFVITTFSVPAALFVGFYLLLDLIQAFDSSVLGGASTVAHFAHIGGTLYGVLICMLLMRLGLVERHRLDGLAVLTRWRQRRSNRADLEQLGQVHSSMTDIVPKAKAADPRSDRIADLRYAINAAMDAGHSDAAADRYLELAALDDRQVLEASRQMTIAETLYRQAKHLEAAGAFRQYLIHHADKDPGASGQARLLLGLLMARYLDEPEEAARELSAAAGELRAVGRDEDAGFAESELSRLSQ
jgi:membrane associated rhomboid family serine protease